MDREEYNDTIEEENCQKMDFKGAFNKYQAYTDPITLNSIQRQTEGNKRNIRGEREELLWNMVDVLYDGRGSHRNYLSVAKLAKGLPNRFLYDFMAHAKEHGRSEKALLWHLLKNAWETV